MVICYLDQVAEPLAALHRAACPPGVEWVMGEFRPDADVLLTSIVPVTAEMVGRLTRCRLIQMCGAGFNHIDVASARARGIPVAVCAGANAVAVAELTVGLILGCLRQIPWHDAAMRRGEWPMWARRHETRELFGKTVGIVGLGAIGRQVARRLAAFEVDLLYTDLVEPAETWGARRVPLEELLARSDVVTLHVPLTPATRHLIGRRELALMKPTAVLVNTARGPVVDYDALAEALAAGRLKAAGLDVHDPEPPPPNHPIRRLENVILTPHIGGGTWDTMQRVIRMAYANVARVLAGEAPRDVVT